MYSALSSHLPPHIEGKFEANDQRALVQFTSTVAEGVFSRASIEGFLLRVGIIRPVAAHIESLHDWLRYGPEPSSSGKGVMVFERKLPSTTTTCVCIDEVGSARTRSSRHSVRGLVVFLHTSSQPQLAMSLPYAVDAEQPLQPSELAVLRDQYFREVQQGHASTQTKFNYAWGLVKSRRREDMAEGVGLLTGRYKMLLVRELVSPLHRDLP